MNLGLDNRVALVTGGSRGIGEAIITKLLEENVKVYSVSRSESDFIHQKNFEHISCDLSTRDSCNELLKELNSKKVNPDILINNVGGNLGFTDPLLTSEAWTKVSDLNLTNAMILNEGLIPNMIKNQWGRICHVSSISALENQGPPAYCAAKAALNAYVRSLGRYVAKDNVILTSIMPGAIFTKDGYWDTTMSKRPEHVKNYLTNRMAIQRFGSPEEIANLVTVMVSDLFSFCPGAALLADGGQGRVFHDI